jgi:hypothetical protein
LSHVRDPARRRLARGLTVPDTLPPEPPEDEPGWIEHGWDSEPERPPILGLVVLFTLAIVVGGAIALAVWLLVTVYLAS